MTQRPAIGRHDSAPIALLLFVCVLGAMSCAPALRRIPAADDKVPHMFWTAPSSARELYYGVGGRELEPAKDAVYNEEATDPRGFSTTIDLKDETGGEWRAKIGVEAQSEVTSSRLVWALGYPQPPAYYVPVLKVREKSGNNKVALHYHARVRPKVKWIQAEGIWSWYQNPFVGTPEYRGLLVLMMILNSTDLKADNNELTLVKQQEPPSRWYIVKDLGATLGATGRMDPVRNDINQFERHGFIKGVRNGHVQFEFRGRHQPLLRQITPADVRWTCERLAKLTDEQWRDAFRAGGYADPIAKRYIERIRVKIREGLALPQSGPAVSSVERPALSSVEGPGR